MPYQMTENTLIRGGVVLAMPYQMTVATPGGVPKLEYCSLVLRVVYFSTNQMTNATPGGVRVQWRWCSVETGTVCRRQTFSKNESALYSTSV